MTKSLKAGHAGHSESHISRRTGKGFILLSIFTTQSVYLEGLRVVLAYGTSSLADICIKLLTGYGTENVEKSVIRYRMPCHPPYYASRGNATYQKCAHTRPANDRVVFIFDMYVECRTARTLSTAVLLVQCERASAQLFHAFPNPLKPHLLLQHQLHATPNRQPNQRELTQPKSNPIIPSTAIPSLAISHHVQVPVHCPTSTQYCRRDWEL